MTGILLRTISAPPFISREAKATRCDPWLNHAFLRRRNCLLTPHEDDRDGYEAQGYAQYSAKPRTHVRSPTDHDLRATGTRCVGLADGDDRERHGFLPGADCHL